MNKRLPLLSFFIIALLILIVGRAWADSGVQGTLTPDKNELAVGDPVQLTLEVTHPAGYQIIIPQLDQIWGAFEVWSQSGAVTTTNDDGTETTRQTIEVTLFNLGDFQTPELLLTISNGAGQVFEEAIPSISLSVVPTLAEDDNELRDIKPQASLNVPAAWPWIVGGLLLAVLAGFGGYWAFRRWRGKPLFAPAVDNRPPWQVAYDELTRIEGLGLVEQRRFKEYYTLVSNTLRTYLEKQFDLSVFERTTFELRTVFRQSNLAPEHSRRFLDLFGESDLVKFAKFAPPAETAHQAVAEARELVNLTAGQAVTEPRQESELEEFLTENKPPVTPMATAAKA